MFCRYFREFPALPRDCDELNRETTSESNSEVTAAWRSPSKPVLSSTIATSHPNPSIATSHTSPAIINNPLPHPTIVRNPHPDPTSILTGPPHPVSTISPIIPTVVDNPHLDLTHPFIDNLHPNSTAVSHCDSACGSNNLGSNSFLDPDRNSDDSFIYPCTDNIVKSSPTIHVSNTDSVKTIHHSSPPQNSVTSVTISDNNRPISQSSESSVIVSAVGISTSAVIENESEAKTKFSVENETNCEGLIEISENKGSSEITLLESSSVEDDKKCDVNEDPVKLDGKSSGTRPSSSSGAEFDRIISLVDSLNITEFQDSATELNDHLSARNESPDCTSNSRGSSFLEIFCELEQTNKRDVIQKESCITDSQSDVNEIQLHTDVTADDNENSFEICSYDDVEVTVNSDLIGKSSELVSSTSSATSYFPSFGGIQSLPGACCVEDNCASDYLHLLQGTTFEESQLTLSNFSSSSVGCELPSNKLISSVGTEVTSLADKSSFIWGDKRFADDNQPIGELDEIYSADNLALKDCSKTDGYFPVKKSTSPLPLLANFISSPVAVTNPPSPNFSRVKRRLKFSVSDESENNDATFATFIDTLKSGGQHSNLAEGSLNDGRIVTSAPLEVKLGWGGVDPKLVSSSVHGQGMESGDLMPSVTPVTAPLMAACSAPITFGDLMDDTQGDQQQNKPQQFQSLLFNNVSDELKLRRLVEVKAEREVEQLHSDLVQTSFASQPEDLLSSDASNMDIFSRHLDVKDNLPMMHQGGLPVSNIGGHFLGERTDHSSGNMRTMPANEIDLFGDSQANNFPAACGGMGNIFNQNLEGGDNMLSQVPSTENFISNSLKDEEWQRQQMLLSLQQLQQVSNKPLEELTSSTDQLFPHPYAPNEENPKIHIDNIPSSMFDKYVGHSPNILSQTSFSSMQDTLKIPHSMVVGSQQLDSQGFAPIPSSQHYPSPVSNMPMMKNPAIGDRRNEYNTFRSNNSDQMVPSPEMDQAWKLLQGSLGDPMHVRDGTRVAPPSEKNIWADMNANSIPSSSISSSVASHDTEIKAFPVIPPPIPTNDEQNLCRTFQSLGLQKIWDSSPQASENDPRFRDQMLLASSLLQQQQQQLKQQENQQIQMQLQHYLDSMSMWTPDIPQGAIVQPSNLPPSNSSVLKVPVANPSQVHQDNNVDPMTGSGLGLGMSLPSSAGSSQLDLLHPIGGPSGVQAILPHGTHSNFSSVVPRRTNIQEAAEYSKTAAAGSDSNDAKTNENLLTSPRTHFRPIKSQEEQTTTNPSLTTFTNTSTTSHVQLDLPYQRSNSGTLFLEKDAMEGSPKKYMIYKEPVEKLPEPAPLPYSYQESSLVPKFKVVKNEKFCQTEDVTEQEGTAQASADTTPLPDSDDDNDVFGFQMDEREWSQRNKFITLAMQCPEYVIEKLVPNLSPSHHAGFIDTLLEGAKKANGDYLKNKIDNPAIIWSAEGSPSRVVFRRRTSGPIPKEASSSPEKQERVIDTPAARAIWSCDPRTQVTDTTQKYHHTAIAQNIDPSIKALWAHSPDKVKLSMYQAAEEASRNRTWSMGASETEDPDAEFENSRLPAWTMKGQQNTADLLKHIPNEWAEEESVHISRTPDSDGPFSQVSSESWIPEAQTLNDKLYLKAGNSTSRNVNKDRIWSSGTGDQFSEGVVWSTGDDSTKWSSAGDNSAAWSKALGGNWSEEKYLKARWSQYAGDEDAAVGFFSTPGEVDDLQLLEEAKQWEKNLSMDTSEAEHQQEDLEELDPGWQLSGGFAWAPQCGDMSLMAGCPLQGGAGDAEDFDDAASLSSSVSSSSSEVVMMPTENGGTLAVQVEYLDEELYDKIFGAPDPQMAGSLPDLPNNQVSFTAVFYMYRFFLFSLVYCFSI